MKDHVDHLQNDPDAIEHEARARLHYTRPGEVIYTLNDKPADKTTAACSPPQNSQPPKLPSDPECSEGEGAVFSGSHKKERQAQTPISASQSTIMRARLLICLLLAALTAHAQQLPNDQQQKLLDLTNKARIDQGLQPLHWDPALAAAAQAHAQKMFDQHSLSHQLPGEPDLQTRAAQAGTHFRVIAENVAMGNGAEGAQKEWMNSPPHRANTSIQNSPTSASASLSMQVTGMLLWTSTAPSRGWLQTRLSRKSPHFSASAVVDTSRPPDAARKDCAVDEGDASGTHPLFVMRWESSSLDRLPDQLEQRLGSGRYKTASVGACSNQTAGNQGFTTYRVAVLLY